jgi:hypothetical protein
MSTGITAEKSEILPGTLDPMLLRALLIGRLLKLEGRE